MSDSAPRVAATYVRLLHEYLQGQGVPAQSLIGPPPSPDEHFVPLRKWQQWLSRVEQFEGRDALGLRVAAGIEARHFGVVGYAALACATLGEALHRMERYHASVYDVNPAVVKVQDNGNVCIEWGVERGRPGRLVDETAIASLVQLCRDMTGRHIPLRQVCFVNDPPPDLRPFQDFFAGEVLFRQPVTRVVFEAPHLLLPMRKSDPGLLAIMDQEAERLLARVADLPAEVDMLRRELVILIRQGDPSLQSLAQRRHLSIRSLQRRLADHGWKFQELLDQTRRHLAESYLRDPGLDLAEISLLLGYSEQSAFTRAFRTWVGMPPAQWRREQLAPDVATDD